MEKPLPKCRWQTGPVGRDRRAGGQQAGKHGTRPGHVDGGMCPEEEGVQGGSKGEGAMETTLSKWEGRGDSSGKAEGINNNDVVAIGEFTKS